MENQCRWSFFIFHYALLCMCLPPYHHVHSDMPTEAALAGSQALSLLSHSLLSSIPFFLERPQQMYTLLLPWFFLFESGRVKVIRVRVRVRVKVRVRVRLRARVRVLGC